MNKVHNFQRKRPHVLPPLTNSRSSPLRPVDSLQPPDLLLLENRLGSPAPRPSDPREAEYVGKESNATPVIKISGPRQKENEKHNLMKFDLLSDSVFGKINYSLHQKANAFKVPDLESGRSVKENLLSQNLPKKTLGKFPANLDKGITSQAILPLEEHRNLETSEPKLFQIPNRYTLLKPIGKGMSEN